MTIESTPENLTPSSTTPADADASHRALPDADAARLALLIVFLVVFIDLLGFGIVLPLLPRYVDELLPNDWADLARGLAIAVLYSSFSAMQFVFAPIWGRVSDRVGRRPILLIGLAGSVVFYALFAYASTLTGEGERMWGLGLMLVSRVGAGIAGATIATAQAIIADCTTPEKRSRGMALIGAAFGIGFAFGPLLAYATLVWFADAPAAPGLAASLLSLLALLLGLRLLPETLRPGTATPHRSWLNLRSLSETLNMPTVGLLVLTFFLATFAFANFEGTLSLLTKRVYDYNNRNNFLIFSYVGFSLGFANGFLYRRLSKTWSEETLMKVGVFQMLLGIAGLGAVASLASRSDTPPSLTLFLLALALAVFGFAFLTPSIQSLISRRSDPHRQGEVLGVNQSFSALARILGPALGLTLFPIGDTPMLPYLIAAVLLGVVLFLTTKIRRV